MVVGSDRCTALNDGTFMPLLGFGCSERGSKNSAREDCDEPGGGADKKITPESQRVGKESVSLESAVEIALDNGYRHIDTAYMYENEDSVGKGIQKWLENNSKHKREDLFIVSKLPSIGMSKDVQKFLELSLKKLSLSYVDLYLVHSPIGMKYKDDETSLPKTKHGLIAIDEETDLIAIWKEMELMVKKGLTKSIGVSNFNIRQIKKILAVATIPPTVNQVEMHLNFQQKEMVDFCSKSKIVVTAYAPLGSPGRDIVKLALKNRAYGPPPPLDNPVVKLIANNHGVTTAQILIKFFVQQGIVTIPKSVTPERIKSNAKVFDFTLSETEVGALKLMDKEETGRYFYLSEYPGLAEHPEYPF